MKLVRIPFDRKKTMEEESMSESRNVRYALRTLGYQCESIKDPEEKVRVKFGIPADAVCVDGCCHESTCPLILLEVETDQADKGLKQLEKAVELFAAKVNHKLNRRQEDASLLT